MNPYFHNLKNYLLILSLIVVVPATVQSQTLAPSLDDTSYDFGLIPIGTIVHHTFLLKNKTNHTLEVGKVSTSCNCTTITSYPKEIPANGQGEIVAVMDHRHTGYTDVAINLQTGPALKDLYTFHLVGLLVDAPTGQSSHPELIAAQDALSLIAKKSDVALVDVRPTNLYVQAHAKGSQNVPPFALEARQDLKTKTIFVINDGSLDLALLNRLDRLKKLGFKEVRLLDGGLRSWQAAGGVIEGSETIESANIAAISAGDFYSEQKEARGWLVVSTDKAGINPEIATAYPIKTITLGTDAQAFTKNLKEVIRAQSGISRVLVTNAVGNNYDLIEAALHSNQITMPVYYLQGGSRAYTVYSQEQTLGLTAQKMTLLASKASIASNQASGQVVHGGGCSSCGH